MSAFDGSSFRHAIIKADKDAVFSDLGQCDSILDGRRLSANCRYVSFMAKGGQALHVLPLSSPGRQASIPSIGPTSQGIQDHDFDPFAEGDDRLAAVSTDGKVYLWKIPNGGITSNLRDANELTTSTKSPLRGLAWHPSAQGVLAVRSSRQIFVFDTFTNGKEGAASADGIFKGDILSFCWNADGSAVAISSKDKVMRLLDPRREGAGCVLQECAAGQSHTGARFCNLCWLGDSPYLLSAGHSSSQDRELYVWDSRNLAEGPVLKEKVDSGNMSPLYPIYDADTGLLSLMSRGSCSVRLYEVNTSGTISITALACETVGSAALHGVTALPKQANALMDNEVIRLLFLNVADSGRCVVQPVSTLVPRKQSGFQQDLFPDTRVGGPPAMSAAHTEKEAAAEKVIADDGEAAPPTLKEVETASVGDKEESKRASSIKERLSSLGSNLKYRHLQVHYPPKEKTYFDLRQCKTANEGPEIACSDLFWATAYTGGGGPVYVGRHDALGRIASDCAVVNGHQSAVSDIAFSPFAPTVMATASSDCTVRIWNLPEKGSVPSMGVEDSSAKLTGFGNSVRTANFHPTCANILACTSLDKTIRLFDIESSEEITRISIANCASDMEPTISNLSFNYSGSQFAVACKDKVVRLCDPRAGSEELGIVGQSKKGLLGRNLRVEWCNHASSALSVLMTASVGASGMRVLHTFDPRNLDIPLTMSQVDTAAGQLYPMYDASMGAAFVVGKGDSIMRVYEIEMAVAADESVHALVAKACEFPTAPDRTTYTGMCMLPKRGCDIKKIECARILKLTTSSVQPLSISLPRADNLKGFFQDDVYLPVRSQQRFHSAGDYKKWLSGEADDSVLIEPYLESLQPEGMVPLSEKPKEEPKVSRVTSFRLQKDAEERERREKEESFDRLTALANQRASYNHNKNLCMGDDDEVDSDDNWSDSDD
eukprot:GSChrysophyteH1.ASY1.ANO1.918.1 assembled CDS